MQYLELYFHCGRLSQQKQLDWCLTAWVGLFFSETAEVWSRSYLLTSLLTLRNSTRWFTARQLDRCVRAALPESYHQYLKYRQKCLDFFFKYAWAFSFSLFILQKTADSSCTVSQKEMQYNNPSIMKIDTIPKSNHNINMFTFGAWFFWLKHDLWDLWNASPELAVLSLSYKHMFFYK